MYTWHTESYASAMMNTVWYWDFRMEEKNKFCVSLVSCYFTKLHIKKTVKSIYPPLSLSTLSSGALLLRVLRLRFLYYIRDNTF